MHHGYQIAEDRSFENAKQTCHAHDPHNAEDQKKT
eukprot:CAMPEP_0172884544 /NCGR_PEP_ID=MMETSP1075-20121228/125479_1 /TAXON_ID=2916 /ORGANISM="Ceratium fusus, Strain PA161109" /LENGTH=34 /DNA_ID= /DNA_START= /DNA_END= /DNA_ORIENTATION=